MIRLKTLLQSKYLLIFLIFLVSLISFYKIKYDRTTLNNKTKVYGYIKSITVKDNKVTIELLNNKYLVKYYLKDSERLEKIEINDYVLFKGKTTLASDNTNFHLFNYKLYLKSKKIDYIFTSTSYKIVSKNNNILFKAKNYIINRIDDYKSKNYLYTFILGDKGYIDNSIYKTYQDNGVSHLLAISGMHVSFLSSFILLILNKIKKSSINDIIVIMFLLFYSFLVNFTPSITRAFLLFLFLFIDKKLKLNIKTSYILIYIALTLLLYNPFYIYNLGFVFSFTISFFLIITSSIINKRKNYFSKLFMTSFISFLASIPILINNFFSINLTTILSNMFFVPFVSFIIFPFSFLTLLFKPLDNIFLYLTKILEYFSIKFNIVNISLVLCYFGFGIIIYYLLLIIYVILINNKSRHSYIPLIIFLIVIIIHSNYNNFTNDKSISFIDIGQGDSILLRLKDKSILIDTGGILNYSAAKVNYSLANNIIIPYLNSLGISKLDYLVITHGDQDHIGEANNMINNFKVLNIIKNSGNNNKNELDFIDNIKKHNIRYKEVSKHKIKMDNYIFNFINDKDITNENEDSLVIYTIINNKKILLTGDIGINSEEYLLNEYNIQNIDILKLAHHGSKYSNSYNFLKIINPKVAIIQAGVNNRFNHPNIETIDKLDNLNISYLVTSINGAIKIDLNSTKIYTCK